MFDDFPSSLPTIEICLHESKHPKTLLTDNYKSFECQTFYSTENIQGTIQIKLNSNPPFNHKGIKIELIGKIDTFSNENDNNFNRFLSITNNLSLPGTLKQKLTIFSFDFNNIKKIYETYRGTKFSICYNIIATLETGYNSVANAVEICILTCDNISENLLKDKEYIAKRKNLHPFQNTKSLLNKISEYKIKVEIGIENLLHVGLYLNKKTYHLKDEIIGFVLFKKLNVNLVNMLIKILKIETLNGKAEDPETLAHFELMDGTPTQDKIIPIRYFLKCVKGLTPTIKNELNNNLSVKYYISLELVDDQERSFFKKIEVDLRRFSEEFYELERNIILGNKIEEIFNNEGDKKDNVINSNNDNINTKIRNIFGEYKNIKEPLGAINSKNNQEDNKKSIENKNNINNNDINEDDIFKQNMQKVSSLFQSNYD